MSSVPEVTSVRHCLFTSSGKAAIGLALAELGVGPGDRVLVPSYHCPTMVSPIVSAGALPIFFPITDDGLPAIQALEAMDLHSVKAMIVVHYFGIPRALGRSRWFCDSRGIALIEDCAHAFFGVAEGRQVGTWGDLATASLTKFFPVPEGGCLVSDRRAFAGVDLTGRGIAANFAQLVNTVHLGANHGRFAPFGSMLNALFALRARLREYRGAADTPRPRGINERDPDYATPRFDRELASKRPAAVARFILNHADRARIAELRRRNYRLLAEGLARVDGLAVMTPTLAESTVPYVFPIWVDEPERSYHAIRLAGVPVFRWDIHWPDVPAMSGDAGLNWCDHVFQLGCHQDLSERDIASIVRIVRECIEAGR